MFLQKVIFFLKRFIFYTLLLPLLVCLAYTLAYKQMTAALVFLVLCVIVIYKGLIRMAIPANSVVVRDGKVEFYNTERTVRDRFDFYTRSQKIVELPHFNLLDRPYRIELATPDSTGGIITCRLKLTLGYIMDMDGWQRVYDNFIRYQDKYSLVVKRELYRSASRLTLPPAMPADTEQEEYLKPIIAELNSGLESMGLKIEESVCTFTTGPTLVRIVAAEQETIEKQG